MLRKKNLYQYLFLVLFFIAVVFSLQKVTSIYTLPYPHFNNLMAEQNGLQDIGGIIMGFRCAAADIAWVQLIQYCGEDVLSDNHHQHDSSCSLDLLKYLALRVIRMDPYFYEAYLFSSGILAWFPEVNRPDEAIEILQEGIRNNPKYWPFHLYLSAIVYKKAGKYGEMAALLEEAIQYPDCPLLIKAILANYYKAQKEYDKAMAIWESVLSCDDPGYKTRAGKEISRLKELLRKDSLEK
jgi:tetratricopeptide (TPR) repeat protein